MQCFMLLSFIMPTKPEIINTYRMFIHTNVQYFQKLIFSLRGSRLNVRQIYLRRPWAYKVNNLHKNIPFDVFLFFTVVTSLLQYPQVLIVSSSLILMEDAGI
jgi:hypothetical protein